MKKITLLFTLLTFSLGFSQVEIALNRSFETGDFTNWTENGGAIVTTNPSEGIYCAQLNNTTPASARLLKNANVGIGTVSANQEVTITFDARGTLADGGVAFAEFFSEISGGGVSKSGILGGGPLALNADPNVWKSFSFTTTTGSDVSGGVTLQLTATTGGAATSVANMFYDNISIKVIEAAPSARVQVIHNSADAAASEVDVYIDGVLELDNFAFRTATPFIDVPAETPISIAVAPSTSTSVADAIATFPYNLTDGETYVLVADGIVSTTGYSPDASTAAGFDIKVYAMGRETAGVSGNTDLLVHHGSTDAPTVDVNEVSGPSVLVNDISYGEFDPNGYLELPTADYTINISTADGVTVVASYDAPLATLNLNNAAAVVVASGFLDPTVNSNGPAFGLWVALASGGALVELPPGGSTPTVPTVSAPAPTIPQAEVLSVYSDTYTTNVTNLNLLDFSRNAANFSQVDLSGNSVIRLENWGFYGAKWDAVDVTSYDFIHLDYYAQSAASFQFFALDASLGTTVCCGNAQEPRYFVGGSNPDVALIQGQWVSLNIPLTTFSNYAALVDGTWDGTDVIQWKFEGEGILYFDNVYFGSNSSLGVNKDELISFSTYPNPTQDSWTIKTKNINMSSIKVYDVLGKTVLSISPNSNEAEIDGSSLIRGMYFAQIKTANGISSIKLIKK